MSAAAPRTSLQTRRRGLSRYYSRRQACIAYLGGMCMKCKGTTRLQFDHRRPEEKSFTITEKLLTFSWPTLARELDKCQLLCSRCHKQKTSTENSVEHGAGLTGKRNCRCALCAPLKAAYRASLRATKRRSITVPAARTDDDNDPET